MYVIFGLLAIVLGITYFSNNNSAIEVSSRQFEDMMLSNDVKEVVLIKNQDYVEITLKKEALSNSKYKLELQERSPFAPSTGPHYFMKVLSGEQFAERFEEIKQKSNAA